MKRILAVDDDKAMTDFYASLFSEAGYEVYIAADAGTGMGMFHDVEPDLMVLDADMPGGGGELVFKVARKILDRGVPVVFVTGMPERVIDFALTQTKVRVFKKPVRADELVEAVRLLLPE